MQKFTNNNKLYLYLSQDNDPDNKYSFIIYVANGNYNGQDFVIELQNKLRAVKNSLNTNMFGVSYNFKNNNITISMAYSGFSFKILTPNDLKTSLNNAFYELYDKSNYSNEVLDMINHCDLIIEQYEDICRPRG